MSQADRDAAYNNGAAVPGDRARLEVWAEASASIRAAEPMHLDLAYGPGSRNRWDLFPAADPQAPCLVFIHGGYWQRMSRESFASVVAGVRAHGWSAALPGYTLAPDITLTGIVAELRRAFDWLEDNGAAHGISGPLITSGWSAGGHLAALMLGHPAVSAGLAISGVFELGPLRDTYLNAALKLSDTEIATLSPARLTPMPKPLAIAYGTQELPALVRNSRQFSAHRASAHCAGFLLPVAGANHFTILDQLTTADGDLTRAALMIAT